MPFDLGGVEAKDALLRFLWNRQNGRGFYTRIPLGCSPSKDWVVSIERITKQGGYTLGNICLEVFEANTPKQWSKQFADELWGCL